MMRGEIGVNKISHYNYSHTATPIHQPPHFSLPLFSICLHFQTFISAASSWLDCTFFYNSRSIISFRLVSSELYYWNWITCFMITGLTRWCASAQHISISFRAFLDAASTANANNNFSQFLWLFSLQTMSEIESLALVARPRMQQKALSHAEGIVNHVSCLQELDVVLLLSWTSRLLCLPHSYSFPFSIFFFHRGILDSNCSVEENAFNNSHPQLLTSCMNERMCCKWSVPKCGISI